MRLLTDQNIELDPKVVWRREVVFLVMAGIFLGSLTMLNILGITRFIDISKLLGAEAGKFQLPVGVLAYPVTFLCTDFISELFGKRRANLIVWVGFVLNLWVLFILWLGGALPPEPEICTEIGMLNGVEVGDSVCPQMGVPPVGAHGRTFFQLRYFAFGATMASMIAYLVAQFCDVHIFHYLKKLTKGKHLWLRNNGSTLISQMVDSTAVILITYFFTTGALPINEQESLAPQLLYLILTGYVFKLLAALFDTVPFYIGVAWLKKYLQISEEEYQSELH